MTTAEMVSAGFRSQEATITDEPGRPTRQVWFRAGPRERRLNSLKAGAND
jgi:hypothetical protein